MKRFSYVMRAETGERFARDAFASQIGKRVPLRIGGHDHGLVTILAAKVTPDGLAVEVTVETVPSGDGVDG